jgi:hypothetical protein
MRVVDREGHLVAMARLQDGRLHPEKVLSPLTAPGGRATFRQAAGSGSPHDRAG